MAKISLSYSNPLKETFSDEFFADLPSKSGVYFFLDEDRQPLYIGKADHLKRRLQSYRAAKPGQAPEHILEMIELARHLVWEVHPSGEKALARESELIQSLKPRFNIAGTWELAFLQVGVRDLNLRGRNGRPLVEFRLSHHQLDKEYETYGCFVHRGKTKAGYSALLRLLHVCTLEKRFENLPTKLCRAWPQYNHRTEVPNEWLKPLKDFMRGENSDLLKLIMARLLEKENIPPYLYAPLQRDLVTLKDFFETGPKTTRKILRKAGVRRHFARQIEMKKLVLAQSKESVAKLTGSLRLL